MKSESKVNTEKKLNETTNRKENACWASEEMGKNSAQANSNECQLFRSF